MRHIEASRAGAAAAPRSEHDQAVVDGWPLYRTPRGQAAFNDTMATLAATAGSSPPARIFAACPALACQLTLPRIGADGWLPPGRLWLSASQYVLIAHSPRAGARRRPKSSMRVFVFHEFHNSSRNTDTFDTVSSHKGSVFVPLYMSKAMMDAEGRSFVAIVQVAPYDVVSIHASNLGSAGPGMEVARNAGDPVDVLQNLAGIVVARMITSAVPQLRVVNHRGREGQPMLEAFQRHLSEAAPRQGKPPVALPFTPVSARKTSAAIASIDDLVLRRGQSPRIPIAERAIVPRRMASSNVPTPMPVARPEIGYGSDADRAVARAPMLVGPIAPAKRPQAR